VTVLQDRAGAPAQASAGAVPEGTGPPAAIPAEIFAAAAQAYLAGQRLDMKALARQLGISRATLYRRAGNREQLLDQVIWWRARRMLAGQLLGKAALAGPELIGAVVAGALRAIERDWPLHRFLDTDTDTALRILTGSRSVAGRGLTTALECLIDAERDRGAFRPELDSATLAYAIMRICEGFLYADVIADRPPDTARAVTVIRALLAGLDRAAG
jgi:AcrR family transcriptional regulator